MSTQDQNGIEFSILPEENRQHFRLLELPAEILQLVTSQHPPLLQLKSAHDPSGNNDVVLCTPNKTYDLRQVSTSNSVFVAQSVLASENSNSLPRTQLQAIAQPQSTLEIIKTSQTSAIPYITALVPTYTSTGHSAQKDKISKSDLFASIPLSNAECEAAWRDLACFEVDEERYCVIPSANVKLKAWSVMLKMAITAGTDLTLPLDETKLRELIDAEDDCPSALSDAVIRSMSSLQSPANCLALDPDLCARVVGRALLKDLTDASRSSVPLTAFIGQWADLLPEDWRAHAKLSLIDGCYRIENAGQDIAFVEDSPLGSTVPNGTSTSEAKSTLGAKRKWHEKFRAAKKTA